MTETATATIPSEAIASTDAPTTLLATAGNGTGTQEQPTTTQTPPATQVETPTETPKTETEVSAPVVPETYTFTAPEGTSYDPQVIESYSGAAKKAGLTQDAAQKLIEEMAPALAARQIDQIKAVQQGWFEASSADKEFGGLKLQENLGIAKRALDTFDPFPTGVGADGKPASTTPLRTLLEQTGLNNHPEMIRLLFRAGKAISEDKFVGGSPTGAGKVNPADVLYDKTPATKR